MTSGTHLHIGAVASQASFSDTFGSFPQKRKLTILYKSVINRVKKWIKKYLAREFWVGYIPVSVSSILRCCIDTGERWKGDNRLNEMQRGKFAM